MVIIFEVFKGFNGVKKTTGWASCVLRVSNLTAICEPCLA